MAAALCLLLILWFLPMLWKGHRIIYQYALRNNWRWCRCTDFIQRPYLFTHAGLLQDAALVVKLPISMRCAVDYGWEVLDEPHLVTEAKAAKVKAIDYMPAFQVYREH